MRNQIGFALALALMWVSGACAWPPTDPLPRPAATRQAPMDIPAGVRVVRDIAYAQASPAQVLDLYLPASPAPSAMPVIVYFHGGGWHFGDKDHPSAIVPFVARGYAVASVEYRFSQEAPFPAQIYDAKAAVRFLRGHAKDYQLDPNRFAAWGTSSGAHLAALLGTSAGVGELEGDLGNTEQSSAVQAVVDCYGPAVLDRPGAVGRPSLAQFLGGPLAEKKDLAIKASPITFVSKTTPPFLILHGDADKVVSPEQSKLLADAIQKAGASVTLKIVAGAGHGTDHFNSPEIKALIQ